MMWVWIMAAAWAGDVRVERYQGRSVRPIADLRIGVDGVGQGTDRVLPYVCGEIMPMRRISLEGCGNGSGILHQSDAPDMAHFRLRGVVATQSSGRTDRSVVAGIGFMEVQRAADRPGFRFGEAPSEAVEAAGPEASLGVKGRYWFADRGYLTADAVVGVGHVSGAPTVMGWDSPIIPFASLTVGLGL